MKGYAWLVVLVAVLVLQQNVGARSLTKNKQLTALQRLLKVKELVRALDARDSSYESSDSFSYESSGYDKRDGSNTSETSESLESSESSESSIDDKRTERGDDSSSGLSASKEGDDKGWSNDVKAKLLQDFYKMLKRV